MNKASDFDAAYRRLNEIESHAINLEALDELRRTINGRNSLLISRAADIAGDRKLTELIPDLISTFARLLLNGARADKQCAAKISIANALNNVEYLGDEVFLAGAKYVQMEGSFGPPVDTAVKLRCACAYGLARIGHPDAHYILADLLVDPEHSVRQTDPAADDEYEVRAAAAKALAFMGTPEAELLLRLKVLTGDKEIEVISECFKGLLAMSPTRSVEFTSRFLQPGKQVFECAALAIGTSKIAKAYSILKECWDANLSPAARRTLLLPISLTRSDEAFDFLLSLLHKADSRMATEVLSTLTLYADDDSVRKIRGILTDRGDNELLAKFDREFGYSA